MRIDRVRVDGFGRLHGFDTGGASLPGLVAVLGPNEAGKSTLFTFLTTALYGFLPATRERNPQVPWGAEEAGGSVRIRLDVGGCAEIERRLRSQPSGKLTVDGVTTELRNQPLPWVEHVPRTVFRQVFALTLADLAGLSSETWGRIQDKVVGTMGASDLRSARIVAEELEREAGEIWRPSRRGNQRLRDLQAESRALRARRSTAYERDLEVRCLVEEGERLQARLHSAREQRQRDRLAVERAQSWLPVRKRRERIVELREQGGDRAALAGLPADPRASFDGLEAEASRARNRLGALEAQVAERRAEVGAFDERAQAFVARRDEVLRLVGRAAACAAERARGEELVAELRAAEEEMDAVAASILSVEWREVSAAALETVQLESLRDSVARARVVSSVHRATPAPTPGAATLLALVAGVALLAWGATAGVLAAAVAGGALAAVAATLVVAARRQGPIGNGAHQATRDAGRSEVRAALAHLPIRPEHLERPAEPLVAGLARMQRLVRERAQRSQALEAARARVAEIDRDAAILAGALGLPGEHAEHVAPASDLQLRRAERLQHAASSADRDLRGLSAEQERVAADLRALDASLDALRGAAEALSPGDARAGLQEARVRLAAHRRADELTEELERSHPDLFEIEARIDAAPESHESWKLDDDELARTRGRLEELEAEIEELLKRSEALARDAAHLRELETVDAVDSEIASLRELEVDLIRERDRKWVLAQLLRAADRRFREEHQPDLLRRASSYLTHLTGGRYDRLVVEERGEVDLFQIVGPGLPAPVPLAPPVSTGTLEQAYLSLRLAIVDHLDQGGERLPLFVDEVFVNWDRARRARGLEVIAGVANSRQVFVFTCHEGLAAELEARGGVLLALEGR